MKAKEAGEKTADALRKGLHVSDKVIRCVEKEHRVDEWSEKNIEAILTSRKGVQKRNNP